MDDKKKNSQIARLLAALALIGAVLLTVVVISGATGGDDGSGEPNKPARQQQQAKPKTNAKSYEVEEGDTLITISRKTGIPVGKLERLNPDIDPQALQLGQEIKLR